MKTLITFSGGIDSTYALWKLLNETQDEVTALALNTDALTQAARLRYDLRSFNGVDTAETVAAADWLKANVRDFTLIVHDFDPAYAVRGYGNINSPQTYMARYAAPRINAGEFARFICTSEKENDGWSNGGSIDTRRPGSIAALDVFSQLATQGSIEFPLIASNYTQANAFAEMPSGLLAIIDPDAPDDQTFKAKKRRWLKAQLASGKTPAQVWDAYYANCTVYPNKWFSMKWWIDGLTPTDENTWPMPEWPVSHTVTTTAPSE